jgi:protein-S-isoprenylcysteine O-methyltransferase Ste14
MDRFKKWQDRNSPTKDRFAALLLGALIFPTLIPVLLILVLPKVDERLGIGSFYSGWGNILVGVVAIVAGGILALWTIENQIRLASGTPFPMLPTQKLLIVGPFKYCRNPMTLGTIMAYGGISILIGSYAAVAAVVLLAGFLIAYLKLVEEKELEIRFGSEYVAYKKNTPFMIPTLKKRNDLQ